MLFFSLPLLLLCSPDKVKFVDLGLKSTQHLTFTEKDKSLKEITVLNDSS